VPYISHVAGVIHPFATSAASVPAPIPGHWLRSSTLSKQSAFSTLNSRREGKCRNRPRLLKKACAGLAWRIAGDAGHRRMRRVSGRRGLPGQQLKIVRRGSHGELLGCSGEAPQLKRS
jgi:hypothetical protein